MISPTVQLNVKLPALILPKEFIPAEEPNATLVAPLRSREYDIPGEGVVNEIDHENW